MLILINSRPIREIQEGGNSSELLNTFPISIIEKIEVIRGPGSVLYGSDAFSGVINIITTNSDQNHASVAALAENGGGFMTYGDVVTNPGDFNIVASVVHRQSAEWNAFFSNQIVIPNVNRT